MSKIRRDGGVWNMIRWHLTAGRALKPAEWRSAAYEALRGVPEADAAHEGLRSPVFSLRPALGPEAARFCVLSAVHPAAEAVLERAVEAGRMGGVRLEDAITLARENPDALLDLPGGDMVRLQALTPVVSRHFDGRLTAHFEAKAALRGLKRSWRDNVGLALPGDPLATLWRVVEIRPARAPVAAESCVVEGFSGLIWLRGEGPEEALRAAAVLWRYAEWAGVGSCRNLGAGAVTTQVVASGAAMRRAV